MKGPNKADRTRKIVQVAWDAGMNIIKCKSANRYKAIHPPRCNNGQPCATCIAKWNAAQLRYLVTK